MDIFNATEWCRASASNYSNLNVFDGLKANQLRLEEPAALRPIKLIKHILDWINDSNARRCLCLGVHSLLHFLAASSLGELI